MSNKHIYVNTIYLYVRMFVMMIISLFSARVVLQILGSSDYGLYNVVGGFVVFFFFFSNSLSLACERFMAFGMGLKDDLLKQKVFSLSVVLFLLLSIFIIVFGLSVGIPFVKYMVNFPKGQENLAVSVYVWSLLLGVFTFIRVPYNAAIIAYERMSFYSCLSIIESLLKLSVLYLLYIGDLDKLLLYAILQTIVGGLVTIVYIVYCHINFNDFIVKGIFDRKLFRQIFSYVGWNAFGGSADLMIMQGLTLILNHFFGTIINAAQAIATQIRSQVANFVNNLNISSGPAITKYYAAKDFYNCEKLLYTISKLDYLMLLILCVPIIMTLPIVLDLWLGAGEYPSETIIMTMLVLVNTLIDTLPGCAQSIVFSTGIIKEYQVGISVSKFVSIVMVYVSLLLYPSPELSYYVLIVFSIPRVVFQIFKATKILNVSVGKFVKNVIAYNIIVTVLAFVTAYFIYLINFVENQLIDFVIKGFLYFLETTVYSFVFGLTYGERNKLIILIKNKIVR